MSTTYTTLYTAFTGTFSAGVFTASGIGKGVTSITDTTIAGDGGVLGSGAGTPTFTEASAFGLDGNNNGTTWTYLGTATVGGMQGFLAQGGTSGTVDFFAPGGTALTLPAGSTSGTSFVAGSQTNLAGDWNLATATNALACFCAGTMISTPGGGVAIEDLKAGDLVLTASGAAVPVRWLGRSTVSRLFADPARILPVLIRAGALGDNMPLRDLSVSVGHALVLDGVLVNAGGLVNGTTIVRNAAMPLVFNYYHIELDRHDVVLAEGVPAESFLDGAEDMNFDNLAERPAVVSGREEMPLPRAKSARQVPQALRDRIAARVAVLSPEIAVAA